MANFSLLVRERDEPLQKSYGRLFSQSPAKMIEPKRDYTTATLSLSPSLTHLKSTLLGISRRCSIHDIVDSGAKGSNIPFPLVSLSLYNTHIFMIGSLLLECWHVAVRGAVSQSGVCNGTGKGLEINVGNVPRSA